MSSGVINVPLRLPLEASMALRKNQSMATQATPLGSHWVDEARTGMGAAVYYGQTEDRGAVMGSGKDSVAKLDDQFSGSAELDIVARAKSGSPEAFEELYRLYVGRTYALCLRMAGDAAQAEELTQEVFVKAWRKLTSFRGKSTIGTWLHRLTVNTVLSKQRADSRYASRVTTVDDVQLSQSPTRDEHPGRRVDLETAIAGLPRKARSVFVLHDVEGHRHAEIAKMMGIAVGTAKAQLHRARKLLREDLEQ
jgi:RNA polymerase sigma-70 factor (ECF subfamily)